MFEKEKMDERQLWIRGKVFMHSFIYTFVLLLGNALVQASYGHWTSSFYENVLILWLVLALTSAELIIKEAYVVQPTMRWFLILLFGFTGLGNVVRCLGHLLGSGQPFVTDGRLADDACGFVVGLLTLSIAVVLLCKPNRVFADAEDD